MSTALTLIYSMARGHLLTALAHADVQSGGPALLLESVGGVEFYLMEQEGSRFSELETAQRCLATWRKMRGTT